MTATLSRHEDTARATYTVEPLRDREVIRSILLENPAYSAYALAQLDPALFDANDWYRSTGPSGSALVLHSRTGLGRALFSLGDVQALDSILALHPGPRFSFGSLYQDHRATVEKYFLMTRPQTMYRMAVTNESFRPVEGKARRLRGSDVRAVNRIYSADGGPAAYKPEHLEEGVYYGIEIDGRLRSIAGTHVVSRAEGVAVVGNVFTHPRWRGGGLATEVTSAVTQEVLEFCNLVVLTVEELNTPALSIYHKLGYRTQCTLHETPLIRKDPFGIAGFLRRTVAAWRGRGQGKEIVTR